MGNESLVGRRFIGIWQSHGDVIWEITTEPTTALDGSNRLFVWARCVGRPEREKRRGRKPFRSLPKPEKVHFLPTPKLLPKS